MWQCYQHQLTGTNANAWKHTRTPALHPGAHPQIHSGDLPAEQRRELLGSSKVLDPCAYALQGNYQITINLTSYETDASSTPTLSTVLATFSVTSCTASQGGQYNLKLTAVPGCGGAPAVSTSTNINCPSNCSLAMLLGTQASFAQLPNGAYNESSLQLSAGLPNQLCGNQTELQQEIQDLYSLVAKQVDTR